jgi:hypothetical protein
VQSLFSMGMPEYGEGFTFEWMSRTNDSDLLGIVVEVGSLWLFPLTQCGTSRYWPR